MYIAKTLQLYCFLISVSNSISPIKLLNRDVCLIALKLLLEIKEHAFVTILFNVNNKHYYTIIPFMSIT